MCVSCLCAFYVHDDCVEVESQIFHDCNFKINVEIPIKFPESLATAAILVLHIL